MRYPSRDLSLALLAALTLAAGLGLAVWAVIGPPSTTSRAPSDIARLDAVRSRVSALARSGRFDEAEAAVAHFLEHDPKSVAARLMLAELALDRPDPQPERALEVLRPIASTDPRLAAMAKLDEGKAYFRLLRYADAESAWLAALQLDPTIPEAGWALLDLYYVQGRPADARRLALRLHEVEIDPRDRVHLLLELLRQEAHPTDPASVIQRFEPALASNPNDLHSALAVALALARDHRAEEGLELLRRSVETHPNDADAWDALLSTLGAAGRADALADAVARLPKELADAPRFAKHRAQVAWDQRDWKSAARLCRLAWEAEPEDHQVLYHLARALRTAGETVDTGRFEQGAREFEAARENLRAIYDEANGISTLGTQPHPSLYRRLGELRAKMGRPDEARAWLRLALKDSPDDPESLAAFARLEHEYKREAKP